MKKQRYDEEGGEVISTASFVDVMFILIIFFLVASSFHEEERDIRVSLPESDPDAALSSAVNVLVINVRQDSSYYLGDRRLDLESLEEFLLNATRADPDQKVLIRGDRNALHGYVAAAVAACKKAGITEANIGYVVWGTQ